ncbi:hypothetical protein [Streptomyces sp. NPDC058307]|uniref:hypothetical protein n=1 Tax=Streptomyces sp. NPDC058307 TaxID=3346439 RepID=UPI0036F04CF3
MAKLTRIHWAAGVLVLAGSLPLIAGCTLRDGQDPPGRTPVPQASVPRSPAHPSSALNVTRTPPDVSGSTKVFVRLANRTGSQEVTVIPSIKRGTIAVATECAGAGKAKISIGKLVTYTVLCATTSTTTYNEMVLDGTSQDVHVTVTVGAGIHWGLSVGWRPGVEHPA